MSTAPPMDTRYNPLPVRVRVPLHPLPWSEGREVTKLLETLVRSSLQPQQLLAQARSSVARLLGVSNEAVLLTQSGTAALTMGLRALRRSDFDEVLLSTFNCPNVIGAVLGAGMRPVLVDIADGFNPSAEQYAEALTNRTRAILLTHVFGELAELDAVSKLCAQAGVALVDDAAQAFGASVSGQAVGSFGTIGILSFGRHKPLFAGGGGALIVSDPDLREACRTTADPPPSGARALESMLRSATVARCRRTWSGLPSLLRLAPQPLSDVAEAVERFQAPRSAQRMSPFTAGLLVDQLPLLKGYRQRVHEHAARYAAAVESVPELRPPAARMLSGELNFYVVRCDPRRRWATAQHLASQGVETTWLYHPLHRVRRFAEYAFGPRLPRAEAAASETLCLPCRGWHPSAEVEHVASAVSQLSRGRASA